VTAAGSNHIEADPFRRARPARRQPPAQAAVGQRKLQLIQRHSLIGHVQAGAQRKSRCRDAREKRRLEQLGKIRSPGGDPGVHGGHLAGKPERTVEVENAAPRSRILAGELQPGALQLELASQRIRLRREIGSLLLDQEQARQATEVCAA